MELNHAALLAHAISILSSFQPAQHALSVHLENCLRGVPPDGAEATFLSQACQGVHRQERPLRVLLNALYHVHAARVARTDFTLYQLLAYLIVWRADDLGAEQLRAVLCAAPPEKVHPLVGLLVDRAALHEWVVEGWCQFLDRPHVETELLARLDRHGGALRAWLGAAGARVFGPPAGAAAAAARAKAAPTVGVAPRLTAPRARAPPEPVPLATGFKARRVPGWLDGTSLDALEAARAGAAEAARAATGEKYAGAAPPRLHATRSTVERVRREVEAAREGACAPLPPARPPPPLPPDGADVRFTAAALLREDALYKKRAAEEAAVLREYEATLRDGSGFAAWRAAARAADAEAEAGAVRARRAEAAAAAAAAAAAVAAVRAHKGAVGDALRAASEVAEELVAVEAAGEAAARAALAEGVKAVEFAAPAAAVAGVRGAAAGAGAAVRARRSADEAALAAARDAAARERRELISQLRALERVPRPHLPTVAAHAGEVGAPGKDPDAGVWMEAMSLVELRERLQSARARDAAVQAERRRAILADKRELAEKLDATARALAARRARGGAAHDARRAASADAAAEAARAASAAAAAAVVTASDAVEARAAARAAAAADAAATNRRAAKMAAFMGSATAAMEARRLEDRNAGVARRSGLEAAAAVVAAAREGTVRAAEAEAGAARARAAAAAASAAAAARAGALAEAVAEAEAAHRADAGARKAAFFAGVDREGALADALAARDPYSAGAALQAREAASARRGATATVGGLRAATLLRRVERLPEGAPLARKLLATLTAPFDAAPHGGALARDELRARLEALAAARGGALARSGSSRAAAGGARGGGGGGGEDTFTREQFVDSLRMGTFTM
jgi:hypothetical protein